MKYDVKIPHWHLYQSMTFADIEAATETEAKEKVVEIINKMAGFHYCDKLPIGTTVTAHRQNKK